MQPCLDNATLTLRGKRADSLPDCTGVYRFFGDDNRLLYVGKSVNIRGRVHAHYTAARRAGRQQRMMHAVTRVDSEPCAGEVGALLRENAAIKREIPLHNRRQRRRRDLWTLTLSAGPRGFLQAQPGQLIDQLAPAAQTFGLYHSESHAVEALRQLARDQGLCLQTLGIDPGRGPCFAYQIRRCRGACAGVETPEAHNTRAREALLGQRILAWPFPAAVLLRESAKATRPGQPRQDWHVVDQWRHIGSFARRQRARNAALQPSAVAGEASTVFDRDAYGILLRSLRDDRVAVICALSGELLANPMRADLGAA